MRDNVFFSNYQTSDTFSPSLDPLGFRTTYMSLSNLLFPQFTVLTNYPRYHSILATIIRIINERHNGEKINLRIKFREIEMVWGIAQTLHKMEDQDATSPLNTIKYQKIINSSEDKGYLRLNDISRSNSIFKLLNYGTLGHYINPSEKWGLLRRKEERIELEETGKDLATILLNDSDFLNISDKWIKNKKITHDELRKFAECTLINPAKIPPKEKKAWEEIFRNFISANSNTSPYLQDFWIKLKDPDPYMNIYRYNEFFKSLRNTYNGNAVIINIINLYEHFEKITSCLNFLFDMEYFFSNPENMKNRKANTYKFNRVFRYITENKVFEKFETLDTDKKYTKEISKFFSSLSKTQSWDEAFPIIWNRHEDVQKNKNRGLYINENKTINTKGQLNEESFKKTFAQFENQETDIIESIIFYYKQNWHFQKTFKYKVYII